MATDFHLVIASLQRSGAALDINTAQLCFLVALRARGEAAMIASFEQEELLDIYEQICEIIEPGAENPRKRATNAVQHLRDHRLLARVDGALSARPGEFTMTRLATAVVDFFFKDEALTRESLTLLTGALKSKLADIRGAAQRAATPETWRAEVALPLSITVGDLISGIEQRQRGLDLQQAEIRDRIKALLDDDWFRAIAACEDLLEVTAATLRELNEILLRDAGHLQALLQEIQQLAAERGATEAEAAAQRAAEQVDLVSDWGRSRQRAWSEYYQSTQRFLRDVVRMDPDRALSRRLREQLASWPEHPFTLVTAGEPSIRLLREVDARVARPPVACARRDWDEPPEAVMPDLRPVEQEERVRAALAAGAATLSEVLAAVLPAISEAERFVAVGRVAAQVAAEAHPRSDREPPWTAVPGALLVEDWRLLP